MKPTPYLFLLGILLGTFGLLSAQDVNAMEHVAWYTLIDSSGDQLGEKPPVQLTNVPFQGQDGVYSNGLYLYSGLPGGCEILSPKLPELYAPTFAVSLEFRLDSLEGKNQPVVIIGDSWRYLGFGITSTNEWAVVFNDYTYSIPDSFAVAGHWYQLTIIYSSLDSLAYTYLDGQMIDQQKGLLIRPEGDDRLLNTHSGNAQTFKGNWRNLHIYSSDNLYSSTEQTDQSQAVVALFPNPAHDYIHVRQNANIYSQWSIMDQSSHRIAMSGTWLSSEFLIELTGLPSGLYYFVAVDPQTRIIRSWPFTKF